MNTVMLYEIKDQLGRIVSDDKTLRTLLTFEDSFWISSYKKGLRFLYLNKELEITQEAQAIQTKIHGLNYLVQQELHFSYKKALVKIQFFPLDELNKIQTQYRHYQVNPSRRSLFQALRNSLQGPSDGNSFSSTHLPHSIIIDRSTCTGCDACHKICPSQALFLKNAGPISFYSVAPEKCDHCGLCESVCQTSSIQISPYQEQIPLDYAFIEKKCEHCQHDFRLPFESSKKHQEQEIVFCPICQIRRHERGSLRITNNSLTPTPISNIDNSGQS